MDIEELRAMIPSETVRQYVLNRVDYRRILGVLEAENCWLTFDELFSKAQCGYNWTDFALQLEQLVEQGAVEYALPDGMDSGCYRIKGGYENDGR